MSQSLKALYDEYLPQMVAYECLAHKVQSILQRESQANGIRPTITARRKDMRSLIKKCLFYGGPVSEVRDRAGVKITITFTTEAEQVTEIIKQKFEILSGPDTKIDSYRPEELGYLGTHFHVRLRPEDATPEISDLECEIILHNGGESLWDSISHQLLYKPYVELPPKTRRRMMRLVALIELFDKEINDVHQEYTEMPSYETFRVLNILEKYFYRIDPREYRRDISVKIIDSLIPFIHPEKMEGIENEMEAFFIKHQAPLRIAYQEYPDPDDYHGLFLHQPESLLIFAMFEWHQTDDVKNAWKDIFPREALEELGGIWGVNITNH
jgi:ppGpp synthetase/RelA/SpoT-type nucleotidyltranferase